MLDIKLDNETAEDGESFWKALTGESRPQSFHEAIVHNQNNGTFAIRKGSYKLTVNGPKKIEEVLDDTFPVKYVLYDLSKDVEESTDVSEDIPETVSQLHDLLKTYMRNGRSVDPR